MDAFLDKYYFLKSRKWWAFIGAVATVLIAAAGVNPYPITTVLQSIVALTIGYISTVAFEDAVARHADAIETAAEASKVALQLAAQVMPTVVNVPPVLVQVPPVVVNVPPGAEVSGVVTP